MWGKLKHLFPPESCNVLEKDTPSKSDRAFFGSIQDETKKMGKKSRLETESVKILLRQLSSCRIQRSQEQRREIGHGKEKK
jgi:hypothetical protein